MTDHENEVFDAFASIAPSGWTRGTIRYRRVGKIAEYSVAAFIDEMASYPRRRGFRIGDALDALRESTAKPNGGGVWFSVVIDLWPGGRVEVDPNYDHEPEWDIPIHVGSYLEEQEMFPRYEAHQPEWYRQKLKKAAVWAEENPNWNEPVGG